MQLVIVESPTKAKTLQKFLGKDYKVVASFGHIRDLPEHSFGVDVNNNFAPKYVILPKSKKVVKFLKEQVKKADIVILATDEDREGEAIAWHLKEVLGLKDDSSYERIVFHEIVKSTIEEALKNPRKIDMNLVNAQQARRILDRIVGYKLSPFLWKKIMKGLSAGRVQSVAVRLVVERERERENFTPQEYWTIEGVFEKEGKEFKASLYKIGEKVLDKFEFSTKQKAYQVVEKLKKGDFKIEKIEKKEIKRNPLPPFTTSTLQQQAWQKFKFPAKLTMQIAQYLYETGRITYHRTDSLNLSNLALSSARKFIIENFGEKYYKFRKYKAKGRVQEAHEAIRPTYPDKTPQKLKIQEKLDERSFKLYDLIWRRFIASQMESALFDSTILEIKCSSRDFSEPYFFKSEGEVLKFEGFLKVYPLNIKEIKLPPLKEKEKINLLKLEPIQHFTQPPPLYTEATLIKALEKEGIGRPSTYAPILSTIQERNYVKKDKNKFLRPTLIGKVVNDLLVEHFPKIVDIKFTAYLEEDLDKIAQGKKEWVKVLEEFYYPFIEHLNKKYKEISKKQLTEKPTDKKCPKCGAPLIIKLGRFGEFYACSRFPECDYTCSKEKDNSPKRE